MTSFELFGSRLGGDRCFIIAEAGVNHNGDPAMARALIDAAADAAADAVKFQTFDPDLLAAPAAKKAEYQTRNTGTSESQLEMLRSLVLPRELHEELQAHAHSRGIGFMSTAFDEGSADFLEGLAIPAFKIPSGELTNHPFLEHVARKGRPMLISTGMATLEEIAGALEVVERAGNPPVALFHCVSSYPAAAADCNLAAMETMRSRFGVPTGWSDHTEGTAISIAAAALGAEIIEKHLTLDRTLPGPDHGASLEPDELAEMVRAVRSTESARGDGIKVPVPAELEVAAVARRSLHARHPLPAGHVVEASDIVALRPGTGISPAQLDRLVGRRLRRSVSEHAMIQEEDLDE